MRTPPIGVDGPPLLTMIELVMSNCVPESEMPPAVLPLIVLRLIARLPFVVTTPPAALPLIELRLMVMLPLVATTPPPTLLLIVHWLMDTVAGFPAGADKPLANRP